MEKIFWESFCSTGRVDMYLIYKEFDQEQSIQKTSIKEQLQSSPKKTEWGVSLT